MIFKEILKIFSEYPANPLGSHRRRHRHSQSPSQYAPPPWWLSPKNQARNRRGRGAADAGGDAPPMQGRSSLRQGRYQVVGCAIGGRYGDTKAPRKCIDSHSIQPWGSVDRGSIQGRYPRAPAGSGNRDFRSPETDLCLLKEFLRFYQIIQQIPWDPTGVGTVTHSHRHSTPHIAHCTVGNSQCTWYMPSGNLRRVASVIALSR